MMVDVRNGNEKEEQKNIKKSNVMKQEKWNLLMGFFLKKKMKKMALYDMAKEGERNQ